MRLGRNAAPVVVAVALLAGCSGAPASSPTSDDACAASVTVGPLPEWARTGFTPPDQSIAHVLGDGGDIVAVLFGYPLQAPPGTERGNKILWVGRVLDESPADLVVHGTSDTGDVVDDKVSGGPGPSIIDVPSAGCWTMDLTWGSHHDVLRLPYGPPEPADG